MMTTISSSELALLSLIKEQPRHAYEIEQVIAARNMRYWTDIGFSSIYRVLSKLEESGFLTGEIQPSEGRGPTRKVYHLTSSGEVAWHQAVLQALAKPERKYSSFLLGLDNLGALALTEAQQAVKTYLADQQSIFQQLDSAVKNHPLRGNFFIDIFFDYLLNQLTNEIKWLEDLTARLKKYHQDLNNRGM